MEPQLAECENNTTDTTDTSDTESCDSCKDHLDPGDKVYIHKNIILTLI